MERGCSRSVEKFAGRSFASGEGLIKYVVSGARPRLSIGSGWHTRR
uniref:Uncharacterized protein n=1 Tax=Arundo donax TaxID=35708 RepID=A0A0A9C826_ARUDO